MMPKTNYIPLKDPNSPKYNEPAYMHYINAMRQQFQAHHPTATYNQLPMFSFSTYTNLSMVEQDIWKARAAADKERYLQELATYVPPPGYNSEGLAIPKWPQWSFTFFISEMQPKLQAENPTLTLVDSNQIFLNQWWNLSSNDKQKYTDLELQDKLRFTEQMQQYQPRHTSVLDVLTNTSALHHQEQQNTSSPTTNTTTTTINKNIYSSYNYLPDSNDKTSEDNTPTTQQLLTGSDISSSKALLH
jgi:hypothetical protein